VWVLLEIVLLSVFLWTLVLLFIWFDPDLRRGWALEAELLERPAVSDDEFVRRFFPDDEIPAEVVLTVRHMLAKELGYPAAQLFADDYFKHFWDEWDADSLIKALEQRFGIVIRKKDAQATRATVRQVSEMVQRLRLEQAQSESIY
jgi:acyl carrier protein